MQASRIQLCTRLSRLWGWISLTWSSFKYLGPSSLMSSSEKARVWRSESCSLWIAAVITLFFSLEFFKEGLDMLINTTFSSLITVNSTYTHDNLYGGSQLALQIEIMKRIEPAEWLIVYPEIKTWRESTFPVEGVVAPSYLHWWEVWTQRGLKI